jgi:methyl-accepting chemotaxis protein
MALDSVSVGKKIKIGFSVSGLIVLMLLFVSYFMLERISSVPDVSAGVVGLVESVQTTMFVLGGIGFCVVCVLGYIASQSIVSRFGNVIGRLGVCVKSLDVSVSQVASSGQSLADGTTGQAANLEETSSAVEELSSLTRNNADNTKEADTIMTSAREAFSEADDSIKKLTASMGDITTASEQTQKIVKTIDEIAFQTNLLALNAAVEAARAGEAGAGFAVVADEVRNLAMRAAEAAKDTSVMIDSTVSKVRSGTELVSETNELFYMASKASERVGALITEIATASEEQASGISQIGNTINDMDRLTQGLAATSEESASASVTLGTQIAELEQIVHDLMSSAGLQQDASFAGERAAAAGFKDAPKPSTEQDAKMKQLPSSSASVGAGKKAEDVIPFDDDEFEDF